MGGARCGRGARARGREPWIGGGGKEEEARGEGDGVREGVRGVMKGKGAQFDCSVYNGLRGDFTKEERLTRGVRDEVAADRGLLP